VLGGTISASNITNVNNIVGPWAAFINTGTAATGSTNGWTFASISSGNLVPFTTATAAANFGWTSNNNNTFNYDVSGVTTSIGVARTANTVRWLGGTASQPYGSGGGGTVTMNGLLNAGTGTITLSVGSSTGKLAIGTNNGNELALTAGTGNITIAIPIANTGTNTGSVAVLGQNTVISSGANTYTGTTTIGGTLQLNTGGTIASTANIVDNGTLTNNHSDTLTINNVVTGTGQVKNTGSGTLTLTNTSTYSGATTITNGTIALSGTGAINSSSGITINGSGAKFLQLGTVAGMTPITLTNGKLDGNGSVGAVTVGNGTGGVVTNGNVSTTAPLTLSSLTFNGAGTININSAGTEGLTVSGALSTTPANGQVALNITTAPVWANGTTYNLISYGSFSGATSDFTLGNVPGLGGRQIASLGNTGATSGFITLGILGDAPIWTGANGGIWSTTPTGDPTSATPNWALEIAHTATDFWASDTVKFNDTVNLDGNTVAPSTTTVTIQGGNVSPAATVFNNSALDYTISTTDASGIAAGSMVKSGSGAATIATSNTFAGGTTLNAGTLNINSATALGTGALVINGGTIDNTSGAAITMTANNPQNWNADVTFAGAADGTHNLDMGTGAVTVAGTDTDRTITVAAGTLTVGELRAATQGLIKQGDGTLVLTSTGSGASASVIAGTLNVAAGTLQINRGGAFGADSGDFTATTITGSGTITNGGSQDRSLFLTGSGNSTFAGVLANGNLGLLFLNKSGSGTLTLAGNSTYTGPTTLSGGTLVIGSGQALGSTQQIRLSNTVTLQFATDGTADSNYPVTMATGSNVTVVSNRPTPGPGVNYPLSSATDSGTDSFGGGTVNFTSGPNVTSGIGTITFDHFNMSAGSATTTTLNPTTANVIIGSVTKNKGASAQTLQLSGTSTGNQVTGTIADGTAVVSLTKAGAGTWTLSGNNSYTGATTISAGTLKAASITAFSPNSAVTISGTGKLDLDNNNNTIGSLAGSGSVLTGTGAGGALTTGGNNTSTAYTGSITGNGGITKIGTGTMTLNNISGPALTVSAGKVVLPFGAGTSSLGGLDATGGTLDVSNNSLIVNYIGATPVSTIRQNLISGYGPGDWSGTSGINSSIANADANHHHTLAYAEASQLGITSFGGQTITGNAVVIKYTYTGDNNLDGIVDLDSDFSLFVDGYNKQLSNPALLTPGNLWVNGDYNYDGVVDLDNDFSIFVDSYAAYTQNPTQLAQLDAIINSMDLTAAQKNVLLSAVPEPGMIGLIGAGYVLFARRRRMHRAV